MAREEGRANIRGSHEHHARSPDCAFFELCNRPESPIAKKPATKRKPRSSTAKSTRLSMQSTLEPEPSYLETPSFADDTIQDEGDSIATAASVMPKGKGKKATAAKGRKKKAEPVVEDNHKMMDAPSEAEEAPAPAPKTAKGRKGKKVKEEQAPEPVERNKSVMLAASGTLIVEEEEPAPKSRRGKKRISDSEADESIIAPAPKRRTRNSVAMQESILPESSMHNTQDEISSSTPPLSKKATATKKKLARASRSRKVSEVSLAPESDNEPLDQLEDELDRQLEDMDVKNPSRTHSPEMLNPKPAMAPLGRKLRNSGGRLENNHHDMFNQMEVDEDEVDREMQQMEEEEQISKPLPKGKGKRVVERKVSVKQQVKEEKARRKAAEEQARREQAELEAEELRLQQEAEEAEELRLQGESKVAEQLRLQQEAEEAEETERLRIKEENADKRRRSAKIKADAAQRAHQAQIKAEQQRLEDERRQAEEEAEAKRLKLEVEAEEEEKLRIEQENEDERIRLEQEEEKRQRLEAEAAAIQEKIRNKNEAAAAAKTAKEAAAAAKAAKAAKAAEIAAAKASKAKGKGKGKARPKSPSSEPEPSTARSPITHESSVHSPSLLEQSTPAQPASARSANRSSISHRSQRSVRTLSPSVSPQSSDAENHPPSSRPSSSMQASSAMTARQTLGATTPKTPSRSLNMQPGGAKTGLHSETPWEEVDLDTIFAHMRSPDKENVSLALGGAVFGGELSEEERKMTVEEWIRYNAVKAEERIKAECEALVGVFEREGMRAVTSLEGVDVIEGQAWI